MQYIIKQSQTTHFYQGINAIAQDGSLSDRAARVLQYAISLPEDWRIIPRQLMKHFGWGRDATYAALKELRKRGYAVLVRCRRAATWYIFNTPQSPETLATFTASNQPEALVSVACKNPDFKNSTNSDALQNTHKEQITENYNNPPTVPEPIPATDTHDVVVHCDEVANDHHISTSTKAIDDVPHIEARHQRVVKRALSRLTEEQAQLVLAAFTLAASKGGIQNHVGYIVSLTKAVINGTFTEVGSAQATPTMTAAERIAADKRRAAEAATRGAMTSQQHAEWLRKTFGVSPFEAPSKPTGGRVSLRQALGW